MTDYLHLDAAQLAREIDQLVLEYPELADDEQLRADMLEGETHINSVVSRAFEQSEQAGESVAGIAERQKALADRKARYSRKKAALRGLIFKIMERADLPKIELPHATFSMRKGVQKVEYNGAEIPAAFTKPTVAPDAAKIKAALKEGRDVPGATLSNAQPTLSVRVK